MKFTMKLLALMFGVLMLMNAVYAESPREQLKQMVAQLQKNPSDSALREKTINLAQKLKPAPAMPEEARRHFVKAVTLQKDAKSPEDYDLPIQEYRQALLLAPWWSDAYFDLASALELKQQYPEAIQNLKFSILANPEGSEARAAQDKVYALEAKSEKQKKEKSEQEAVARAEEAKYGWLLGQWKKQECLDMPQYNVNTCTDSRTDPGWTSIHAVKNGNAIEFAYDTPSTSFPGGIFLRATIKEPGEIKWESWHIIADSRFVCPGGGTWVAVSPTIGPDKQTIHYEEMSYRLPRCDFGGTNQMTLKRQ